MKYSREDYVRDLRDPSIPHIRNRIHFREFYDELGRDPVQHTQRCQPDRLAFIVPQGSIIELGCHIGFNLIHFAQMGYAVTGVDVSEVLLNQADALIRKESPDVQERITLVNAFIEDLNLERKFDTVLLLETLEHVIDPIPILAKAKEILSDNGRIYISAPSIRIGTYSHVRGISVDEAITLCSSQGLVAEMAYQQDWQGQYPNTYVIARHP